MNEMKRRVAAILEFVNRMQVERPAKTTTSSSEAGGGAETGSGSVGAASKGSSTPNGVHDNLSAASSSTSNGIITSTSTANTNANANPAVLPGAALVSAVEAGLKAATTINNEVGTNGDVSAAGAVEQITMAKVFAHMDSGAMMESLTGELLRWQSVYGRYGEK